MKGWLALRGWLARRTLRGRLIAGLLMLLAIACAVVGGTAYFATNRFLLIQLDDQLQASARLYADACNHDHGAPSGGAHPDDDADGDHGPCGTFPGQAQGTLDAYITNGISTQAVVSGKCNLATWEKKALGAVPRDGQPHTVNLPSLGSSYRLLASSGPDGSLLVTGMPTASMESTLHNLEVTELAVFAAVLVLAGVLGTGLVGTSLRPLRRVAATASRVTELPLADGQATLSERVPDTDPTTEVGKVGIAFNRMLGHVDAALARRAASEARLRRFAADASHELRTPLAAIRGYAELARRHPGPVPDEVAHALSRVDAESRRMSVLVDELLLLARLDAGRPLEAEPVDLTRLAIDATSDARAAGLEHHWVLELPGEPVMVRGDGHSLHQVLANLLGNARVHTPPGSTVTVRLAAAGGQRVELSVTDDGPGIPAALRPDLFGRFVRGDSSRSRASGGAGLGLAIVDAVVAAHRGTVRLSSRPGRTRFTITLPRLGGEAGPPETQAGPPEAPAAPPRAPARPA
ncbi:MAG TPA: HAMP domain-containing sensor histidine kinase [Streptosporangiaceae bacterium]|jgi:two-component system OmpR family sensor kinase